MSSQQMPQYTHTSIFILILWSRKANHSIRLFVTMNMNVIQTKLKEEKEEEVAAVDMHWEKVGQGTQ